MATSKLPAPAGPGPMLEDQEGSPGLDQQPAKSMAQVKAEEFLNVFNGNLEVLDRNLRDFHSDSNSRFSDVLKKETLLVEVIHAQYKELYRIVKQDNKDVSSLDKKLFLF
ncbi:uncharacterized protein MELLADRAFT_112432 [Melampsora larici-populina 98AG31]|uniref:Uncharacterized protein n=1 Tax=Melampsora larici-populina (strain 98AG31 / pathotype 3-4-7) TaxID=747676 RepID=F4S6G5_MELLP|nr:uncharacterized protein MELLADRAFT_112432 [Melampsora larici-populina 98AG31]EGF99686.1 hypothetical protein MELLADRAFT_112432 [Melampsora larici-populina 98AG31]